MFEPRGTPAVGDRKEEVEGAAGRQGVGQNPENVAWNVGNLGKHGVHLVLSHDPHAMHW